MDHVARLLNENDELRERVRQLQELLAPSGIEAPDGCHLTRSELRLYRHFMNGRIASRETLMGVLTSEDDRFLDSNIIQVHIARMRRKLGPVGLDIVNVWGRGWRLEQRRQEVV